MNIFEYFPTVALEVQREIINHPKLQLQLYELPHDATLEERFGTILAYCGIEADGYFYEENLETLFNLALSRLKKMGTVYM